MKILNRQRLKREVKSQISLFRTSSRHFLLHIIFFLHFLLDKYEVERALLLQFYLFLVGVCLKIVTKKKQHTMKNVIKKLDLEDAYISRIIRYWSHFSLINIGCMELIWKLNRFGPESIQKMKMLTLPDDHWI